MSNFIYAPPPTESIAPLYIDDFLIIVNKPSGLLSVPGRGAAHADCLISRVQQVYSDALVVHRLDMATSGILLLARGKAMERALSICFQNRAVSKEYTAVVAGKLALDQGAVSLPLITDWPNRPRQKVDVAMGKPALTHYQVLSYNAAEDTSRVRLEPITGRSHQLRVHMLSLGHVIVGDKLYAPPSIAAKAPRLQLHASRICFTHPANNQPIDMHSPIPF